MRRVVFPAFTKNQILFLIIISSILVCLISFMCSFSSKASLHEDINTYYKSVQIEAGDTLWDIASEYSADAFIDIDDYIAEVQKINHILDADDIYEGQLLVVPYYSTAVLE